MDQRDLAAVGVEPAHAHSCLWWAGDHRPGIVGQLHTPAPEVGDAGAVGVGGGAQHVRWPADQHGTGRDDRTAGNQGALPEDAAITQPGTGHENRPIADLAQVADVGAQHARAVPENGALPDLDRVAGPPDQHAVLQDSGVVAHPDVPGAGAHRHPLRQVGTRSDVRATHQHRRGGDLGRGLAGSRAVEAHRSTTGTPTVVRISVPERTALVTGVFSATSASLARWASSSGPCKVIARSIHRCAPSGTA